MHSLQILHDVQTKGGGGVKGLLNNVKKNCTFLKGWLPLLGISCHKDVATTVIISFVISYHHHQCHVTKSTVSPA